MSCVLRALEQQRGYLASHVGGVDEHLQVVLWYVGRTAVLRVVQVSLEGMLVGHHTIVPPPQPDKGVGGHVQQVPHAVLPRALPCHPVC